MPKSSPKYMLARLKVSKTDPFRKEPTIVIGRANTNLCPISAMVAYWESRSPLPNSGPLFTFQSGSFLTRGRFTSETRLLFSKGALDSSEFAGHSFRIGAATTAASANLPPGLIKVLGRWSSDCFERYIKTPPSVLAQVPQTLRSHRPVVIQLPVCSFYSNIIMFQLPILLWLVNGGMLCTLWGWSAPLVSLLLP